MNGLKAVIHKMYKKNASIFKIKIVEMSKVKQFA